MNEFLRTLVEELRNREQFLEDHSSRISADLHEEHKRAYRGLKDMFSAVARRVAALEDGDGSEWEVSKESLHRDLEALDKEIHAWVRETT